MMKPPRALLFAAVAALAVGLLFAFLAVSAGRQQHQAMPAAVVVRALAPAMAPRASGALEAPLVVRKLAVPGAGTRPDDRGSHRAMPDGARHHPAVTKKWVNIGVVIAVVAVVLGALAVGIYCLCEGKRRRRAARELPPNAPSSTPWVVERPQAPAEPHGGRDKVGVNIPAVAAAAVAASENNGCRLCRRPYGLDGDEAPHTLSCGDRFHLRCIRRWVRENLPCPICNASQIVLLGVGATGGETSRRYSTSNFGVQIRDDSVLGRSTFSF